MKLALIFTADLLTRPRNVAGWALRTATWSSPTQGSPSPSRRTSVSYLCSEFEGLARRRWPRWRSRIGLPTIKLSPSNPFPSPRLSASSRHLSRSSPTATSPSLSRWVAWIRYSRFNLVPFLVLPFFAGWGHRRAEDELGWRRHRCHPQRLRNLISLSMPLCPTLSRTYLPHCDWPCFEIGCFLMSTYYHRLWSIVYICCDFWCSYIPEILSFLIIDLL